VTSPSYFGAVSDVAGISALTTATGAELIVDQAWGAHFGLEPRLPESSVRLGADVVVVSLHKTFGSLGQTAALLVSEGELAERVARALRLVTTTSPSSVLLASVDAACSMWADGADDIVDRQLWNRSRIEASALRDGVRIMHWQASPGAWADPMKICFPVPTSSDSFRVAERVASSYGIEYEAVSRNIVAYLLGVADDVPEELPFLVRQACEAARDGVAQPPDWPIRAGRIIRASFGRHEAARSWLRATAAVGRRSTEVVAAYPPGIPILVPGEIVSEQVAHWIESAHRAGRRLVGTSSDGTVGTRPV
jgi:lysine decarboxylase